MTKRLSRHGNSLALVIDRGILDILDIDEKTPLTISTNGRTLLVSPAKDAGFEAQFRRSLRKSHKRYGKVYRRLAGK
jgi:antitoxin component of MazEF toxin-antitoxin module